MVQFHFRCLDSSGDLGAPDFQSKLAHSHRILACQNPIEVWQHPAVKSSAMYTFTRVFDTYGWVLKYDFCAVAFQFNGCCPAEFVEELLD